MYSPRPWGLAMPDCTGGLPHATTGPTGKALGWCHPDRRAAPWGALVLRRHDGGAFGYSDAMSIDEQLTIREAKAIIERALRR